MPVPQYATPDEVMARLHLPPDHPDAAWVAVCTEAANELVDAWLARGDDPLTAPYPAAVHRSAVGVSIRIYRFQDTGTNLDESWDAGPVVSLPPDPLTGYVDLLAPSRPGSAWAPA